MSLWTDPAAILPALTGLASVVYYVMVSRKQGKDTEDIEQLAAYGFNYFPMPKAIAWVSNVGMLVPHWPEVHMKDLTKHKTQKLEDRVPAAGEGVLYE
tara:strand:+ start:63 stop:356 length:294 start_codon:yes stop_codon:yes gene_type:complete